jgi:hypothetical protein
MWTFGRWRFAEHLKTAGADVEARIGASAFEEARVTRTWLEKSPARRITCTVNAPVA